MDYITIITIVYNRWGINDQERVARDVRSWCQHNMDRGTYQLDFMDNDRQVVVKALFDRPEYLTAFKGRFAPTPEVS